MFITRRKYQQDIREAEEKGRYEGRDEAWKEYRMREMSDEIEKLKRDVELLRGPNEGSCEKDVTEIPLAY